MSQTLLKSRTEHAIGAGLWVKRLNVVACAIDIESVANWAPLRGIIA